MACARKKNTPHDLTDPFCGLSAYAETSAIYPLKKKPSEEIWCSDV